MQAESTLTKQTPGKMTFAAKSDAYFKLSPWRETLVRVDNFVTPEAALEGSLPVDDTVALLAWQPSQKFMNLTDVAADSACCTISLLS